MKNLTQAPVAAVLSVALALPQIVYASGPPPTPGAPAPTYNPAAPAGPTPDQMTDDEKIERAKALYGEGNAALDSGDPYTALAKFEEAYFTYAPDLHVFNFNIGIAAHDSGDCVKAKQAFQRFLDLVPEHDERSTAQLKMLEIDRSGCAQQQPAPVPTPTPTPLAEEDPLAEAEEDAPILESRATERERAAEEERAQEDKDKRSGMFIGGVVMVALGAGSLVGSGVSLILARQKAKRLADLASPTGIGFPAGNYADQETYDLEREKLPANNLATIVLLGAGVALTGVGVALLVVDRKRSGKGGKKAKQDGPELTAIGPALTPGGAGVAAQLSF
jgi:hypothetical protein